jgi:hypothetical protein
MVSSEPQSDLRKELDRLRDMLANLVDFPGYGEERIIEIGRGTQYCREGDVPYRWVVEGWAVSTPASYQERFTELLNSGLGWINLSCYGILNSVAIVAIELSQVSPIVIPGQRPSVNLSGPPIDVSTGAIRWSAEGYVIITSAP